MKCDRELTSHIKSRYLFLLKMWQKTEPNGDSRFSHILKMGELSALREVMMLVDERATDCKECMMWGNVCSPDNYPDYVSNPEFCESFEPRDI